MVYRCFPKAKTGRLTGLSCLIVAMSFLSVMFADEPVIHWFEAEEFKGISSIVKDNSVSGGAYVEGKTWYCMVTGIPFPQDGQYYNVWVRAQSDVPAYWYLYDKIENKAFSWFRTEGSETWRWINIGKFSSKIGKTFWPIYLRKPIDQNIPTATGRIDVVAITKADDVSVLERLLASRLSPDAAKPARTYGREEIASMVASRRIADIPYIETPPVIDGVLDDAAWKQAARIADFTLTDGRNMASEQTIGYIAYDDKNFYIAAEMLESQIPFLRKARTIRNDSVWTDDCVEIFIDPGFTQKELLHFIVNPIGIRQDNLAVHLDRMTAVGEEGLDWKAAASIGEDRWFAEVAIPWRILDAAKPQEGEIWGFNLNREQRPKGELSHWNYTGGQFHQPSRFGLISFGQKPVSLEAIILADNLSEVTFHLRGVDDEIRDLSILLSLAYGDKVLQESKKDVPVNRDKISMTSFALPVDKPGSYKISVRIKDAERTLYEITLPFKTYSESLVSVAWPPEMREDELYIVLNTAQHCFFLFANHFPDDRRLSKPQFMVSVPAGVKILDPIDSLLTGPNRYNNVTGWKQSIETRNGQTYHRYIFSLERDILPSRIENVRFFQNSLVLFFEVENGAFPAGSRLPVYFNLKAGQTEEEENKLYLVTLPAIKGRQPREITIHNWLWTFNEGPHTWEPFLETMKRTGFNAISASPQSYYVKEARKRNLALINEFWWFWWNNSYLQEHPENTAITFEGTRASGSNPYVCFTVMLKNDGEVLRESIKSYAQKVADGLADGYIWDLEGPGAWNVCFCERCLAQFKEFAGIKAEEHLTSSGIREKYANQWISFAAHQSSLASRMIRDEFKKNNSNAIWAVYSGMPGQMTMESYRCNWDEIADYIDIACPTGYSYSPSDLNDRFIEGWKDFIKLMEGIPPRENKAKTMPTLTAGYERGQALQPSASLNRMQILRSVASGADGVSFWWWGPMDGRYYQEIARATALIAEFEDFFLKGRNNTDLLKMEEHPYGANVSWEVFTLDSKHLVLLFNHNQDKTCRLNLTFQNIPQGGSGHFYPTGEKIDPYGWISVQVKPLETITIVLETP